MKRTDEPRSVSPCRQTPRFTRTHVRCTHVGGVENVVLYARTQPSPVEAPDLVALVPLVLAITVEQLDMALRWGIGQGGLAARHGGYGLSGQMELLLLC